MHRFRRLHVWEAASGLAREAYRSTSIPAFRGHWALRDQIRRSAISIPANLAEGYGLGTRPQLLRFVRIALGSSYELGVLLEIARDVGVLPEQTYQRLNAASTRTTSLIIGLLKGLSRTGD